MVIIGLEDTVEAGKEIGDDSCIGAGAVVKENIKARSIFNRDTEPKPIANGKRGELIKKGVCVELGK